MGETTADWQVWTHGFPVPGRTGDLARLRQLAALGLDRIVVVPGSRDADPARLAGSNDRFARQVRPALREAQPAARSTNTPHPR